MNTHCAFCRQPFEPGEGKLQDQAGAFHPRCFAVHYKAGEPRRCAHCNDVIWAEHECIGSFGEGPTLRYHKACFVAVGAAHPKPEQAEPRVRRCGLCRSPIAPGREVEGKNIFGGPVYSHQDCHDRMMKDIEYEWNVMMSGFKASEAKPAPAEPEAKASPKVKDLVIEVKIFKDRVRRAINEAMLEEAMRVKGITRDEAQAWVTDMEKRREAKAARGKRLSDLLMHLGVDVANLRGVLTDVSGYLDKVEKGHADLKALVDSWDAEVEAGHR